MTFSTLNKKQLREDYQRLGLRTTAALAGVSEPTVISIVHSNGPVANRAQLRAARVHKALIRGTSPTLIAEHEGVTRRHVYRIAARLREAGDLASAPTRFTFRT